VGITNALLPLDHVTLAGLIVTLAGFIAASLLIYLLVRKAFGRVATLPVAILSILATLCLMLVSAVTVLTIASQNLYWGYILPTVYHNPTILLLKPFAILGFLFLVKAFTDAHWHPSGAMIFASACVTVLSVLAKPNYVIAALPVGALGSLYQFYRKKLVHWGLLILGFVIPAIGALSLQYLIAFTAGSSVGFMPFGFLKRAHADQLLFVKLIMSSLFPLSVYLFYFPNAVRDIGFNLSWLIFFVGLFYTYFIVETQRISQGNFTWSGQITLFVLFVVSMVFFIRQNREARTTRMAHIRFFACLLVLLLHLVCGMFWYYGELTAGDAVWW
jgi:hypothetical protein